MKISSCGMLIFLFALSSFNLKSEAVEEIIVLEKKITNLDGWSQNLSISSLNSDDLVKLQAQHPKQIFRRVPGVWISRGSGQEHLTSMRSPVLTGPGACGSFLLMEDGVPVRPSGFCNVNGLFETSYELSQGIEAITGPASARYGANAMHGVINILTKDLKSENTFSTNLGPNDYQNIKLSVGDLEEWKLNALITTNDGFRENSGYDQQKINFKSKLVIKEWDGSFNLNFTNLNQETAGYINGLDSYKNPFLNKKNGNPEAYRDANSLRISLKLVKKNENGVSSLVPYFRKNEMEFLQHYLPGTPVEKNNHTSFGAIFQKIINLGEMTWVNGFQIEMAKMDLKETQQNALTDSSAFNNATRPKGKHYDYQGNSKVFALFSGIEGMSLGNNLIGFGDIRAESIHYSYDNKMLDGNTRDDGSICGFGGCYYNRPADRTDVHQEISLRLGLETDSDGINYFAQSSLGFRPPQINEAYRLQKKQSVSDLDSEKLSMFEIGSKFGFYRVNGSISFYKGKKKNSIFRDSENFIIDNGKTNHEGMELTSRVEFLNDNSLSATLTYGDHKYEFSSDTSTREKIRNGNTIDTAPKLMGNLIWAFSINDLISTEIEIEYIDSYFTDAANLHEYEGHTLFHLRTSWNYSSKLKGYLRIENLTDENYAERADFNAFGGDRYFPGLPREAYIGLEYSL
ncbi:TonB-dependent receptor [Gammaproteobacteria bacterium]|nr:TonB-dependent receptor [Gammaproteobacteria bacterium]